MPWPLLTKKPFLRPLLLRGLLAWCTKIWKWKREEGNFRKWTLIWYAFFDIKLYLTSVSPIAFLPNFHPLLSILKILLANERARKNVNKNAYQERARPLLWVGRSPPRVCLLLAVPNQLADWLEVKSKTASQGVEHGGRRPHPCMGIKSANSRKLIVKFVPHEILQGNKYGIAVDR